MNFVVLNPEKIWHR